ncbi:MAG: hypothetical protein ACYTGH_00705 [Planctomycetota bacterium]
MRMQRAGWLPVLGLLLTHVLPGSAAQAGDVKLSASKLKEVRTLFSEADSSRFYVRDGIVRPGKSLNFGKGRSDVNDIVVGDTVIQVMYKKKIFGVKVGGRSKALKESNKKLAPLEFKLSNGKKYVLAFPYKNNRSTSYGSLYYRSGAIQKGKLGSESLALYDNNTDGRYERGEDCWQLSKGPLFAPLGTYLCGKSVYTVSQMSEDGSSLSYEPYAGTVGSVGLKFKGKNGAKAYAVYTASVDGGDAAVILNSKNQKAPVGRYALAYGLILSGSKVVAGIKPGTSESLEVTAQQTATAELGKDLKLDFTVSVSGGKVSISPSSIKVKGEGGEELVGFEYDGRPKVMVVKGKKSVPLGTFGYG